MNIGLLASDESTVLVKATGSELDMMISSASGERNMFLLAVMLRISDLSIAIQGRESMFIILVMDALKGSKMTIWHMIAHP